jgi:NTP pyrophosphatase (non-canonical NTP hydrolase)
MVKEYSCGEIMDIYEMVQKVREFEKSRGWDQTPSSEILKMIEEEAGILKRTADRSIVENKIGDLFVQVIQLAIRNKVNLNQEFQTHMTRSEKKYAVKEDGSN